MTDKAGRTGMFREFIVIVLGVLAALGVDAAWQYTQEREQERAYLESLAGDFEVNRQRLESAIERFGEMGDAAAALLQVVQGFEAPPNDSVGALVRRMSGNYRFEPQRAALDDLTSTGGMRLLRDRVLRRELSAFDGRLAQLRDRAAVFNSQWRLDTVGEIELLETRIFHDPAAPTPIVTDWYEVIATREFRNLATARASLGAALVNDHEMTLSTVDGILSLLPPVDP